MVTKANESELWIRLKTAMTERGYIATQAAVAHLLGIRQESVFKWVHGGLPTMANVVTLAEKLGVTVEWLYTGRGTKRPLTEHETALIELYRQLDDPHDRGDIFGQLRALLRRKGRRDPPSAYPPIT